MADFFARAVSWVEKENHRFIGILQGLSEQEWRAPTFCPGWCVADVVAHMTLGARFYAHVIPRRRGRTPGDAFRRGKTLNRSGRIVKK